MNKRVWLPALMRYILQAGNACATFLGYSPRIQVLQPEADEEHVQAAR